MFYFIFFIHIVYKSIWVLIPLVLKGWLEFHSSNVVLLQNIQKGENMQYNNNKELIISFSFISKT